MNIDDISLILERICPLSLANFEFNGFLMSSKKKKKVKKLAFTLGFSRKSVEQAIIKNIDMLVVHNTPERLGGG